MAVSRRDFLASAAGLGALGAAGLSALGEAKQADTQPAGAADDLARAVYQVSPVGRIRNRKGQAVQLEIFEKYVPALLGLERCKQVTVVWWFDRNDTPAKRAILRVHPRGNPDNPLTGVFATHSPFRPNLIALTVCKVLAVKGNLVTVDAIDAFDGTPILDIKSV